MPIKIRMCIVCKERFFQDKLIRLQCINKNVIKYTGKGRSFYICYSCKNNQRGIKKALKKICKKEINLKEELLN